MNKDKIYKWLNNIISFPLQTRLNSSDEVFQFFQKKNSVSTRLKANSATKLGSKKMVRFWITQSYTWSLSHIIDVQLTFFDLMWMLWRRFKKKVTWEQIRKWRFNLNYFNEIVNIIISFNGPVVKNYFVGIKI